MKYISFIITCGGDAGWRFSNCDEWCSSPGRLLFDSSIWTPEKIDESVNELFKNYFKGNTGSTLSDKLSAGYRFIIPFINKNKGVFVDDSFEGDKFGCKLGFNGVIDSKMVKPTIDDTIVTWELNGKKRCKYTKSYYNK